MRKFISNYLVLTSSSVVNMLISTLSVSLISRYLGPDGMGQYSMINALVALGLSYLLLWTQSASLRYGTEEWQTSQSFKKTLSARLPFIAGGLTIALILIIAQPLSVVEKFFMFPHHWWPCVVLLLLARFLGSEVLIFLQIKEKYLLYSQLSVLVSVLCLIYYALLYIANPISGKVLFLATGTALISLFVWVVVCLTNLKKDLSLPYSFDKENTAKVFSYSLPLFFGIFCNYFSDWGDQLIIKNYLTNHEVGLFQSVFQMMIYVLALQTQIIPLLLNNLIKNQTKDGQYYIRYVTKIVPTANSLWSIMVIMMWLILPYAYMVLFGKKFTDAMPLLLVLFISFTGSAVTSLYSVLFNYKDRIGLITAINVGGTVLNMIVSLSLVPKYGIIGSAIGTCIGYWSVQFMYIFAMHRLLGISSLKVNMLFFSMTLLSIVQSFFITGLMTRLAVCFVSVLILLLVIRRFKIIDSDVITQMFSGKMSRIGYRLNRILSEA